MAARPLAILGVTGYTGQLVLRHARELELPVRLVGRRRAALEALARDGEEIVASVDARARGELSRAFSDAFAVVSCAGPFLDLGTAAPEAAAAAGAHYLDSSGEQAWARLLFDRFADESGALLPCFGFDYVPGDLAARLAAEGLEPLDEIVVAYSVSSAAASAGTRRTIARVMTQPQVAWEDGRLVESRFGATTRTVRFPFGERDVVEWSGTEPLTVPRHTQVRKVRSYIRAPSAASKMGFLAKVAAPFIRASARRGPLGPAPEKRSATRFAVVAEARGSQGGRRVTLTGHDPYDLTGRLLTLGAKMLGEGEAHGTGTLAPAEAFDARALVGQLAPLLEIAAVDEL